MKPVIRHLRAAVLRHARDGPTDGQLLESFLDQREEAAFDALLRRHGPMVMGLCRRVLGNLHDAEDAFQATFLVLARKAASVRPREMVGHWLYGVAYRTALRVRTMNAKRHTKEKQARPAQAAEDGNRDDLMERLDHELSRLPEKYRVPVVLCELEGRGRKEVARLLGVPEGTLSWRLAQARKMLARRLSRNGSAVSGVALAAVMAPGVASASLLASTARAGTLAVMGPALAAGVVPARVAVLTEGVIKAMFLTKLKVTAWAAALVLLAGVGASGLTYPAAAQESSRPEYRTQSGQSGYGSNQATRPEVPGTRRPAADDLEALRLEIEALRLELRATRDQVKALEQEVRGRPGQGDTSPQRDPGNPYRRGQQKGSNSYPDQAPGNKGPAPKDGSNYRRGEASKDVAPRREELSPDPRPGAEGRYRGGNDAYGRLAQEGAPEARPGQPADLYADALAALRRLRANPNDKEAADALESALKRLKERDHKRKQ